MNVPHDFWATIVEEEAKAWWRIALGRTSNIPITAPFSQIVSLEGIGRCAVLFVAWSQLSTDEQSGLLHALAAKYAAKVEEIQSEVEIRGVPMRAETCAVTIQRPHRWGFADFGQLHSGGVRHGAHL